MTELRSDTQRWLRIAFINLLIVSILGVLMRYKIAFSFRFMDQKNIMNAHSHFAFAGWISQALMILMVNYLGNQTKRNIFKKYSWIFIANLVCAYGMLFSFPWQGYNTISITFSTLSIFVSYAFSFLFWKDLIILKIKSITHYWFFAALIFSVISSGGPFFLSYMMYTDWGHPNLFLIALYYFLHFQYNGWFFFACVGLFSIYFVPAQVPVKIQKLIFGLFAAACVPAYFLSVLWLNVTLTGYIMVVLAALAQVAGGFLIIYWVIKKRDFILQVSDRKSRLILGLAAVALCIKLFLQAASTIPSLSTFAFGFRPIVIGYLHLVLLGIITLFIIGYSVMNKFLITNRLGDTGIFIFISGIILNELLLMIQGISYMGYVNIPWINELLLGAAICMSSGILFLNIGIRLSKSKE